MRLRGENDMVLYLLLLERRRFSGLGRKNRPAVISFHPARIVLERDDAVRQIRF